MSLEMSQEGQHNPERIGRYRIVRPLSKGGMALVYEARKDSLGGVAPRVAIKVILPDYAASSTFRELFINEARLGAAMHHQNLVQILDFDSDGDRYFLVMEYVQGFTLSKMVGLSARHGIDIPMCVICEIGRQACEGLHYAHQAVDGSGRALNMIHRDIKPSNLIVNPEGGVKILDFGISKGRLRSERAGSVKGTWGYMAPEQANGERIGPNADVFALGIVLFEMASRTSMFKGRKEEEIRQLLMGDHAGRLVSTLPPAYAPLASVLLRALHVDPKMRFASAAEFGRQLADLLPDPLTVRDEMVGFHTKIRDLHKSEAPRRKADEPEEPSAQSARLAPRFTLDASRAGESQQVLVMSAMAGMVAVVVAFVLGYALYRFFLPDNGVRALPDVTTTMEVAGQDRTAGERPVPVPNVAGGEAGATEGADAPAEAAPADPELGPNQGYMTLEVVQDAEIYVDKELLRPPYGDKKVFDAGRHIISVRLPDGVNVSYIVDLEPGEHEHRVWDFDKWDFR